MSSWAKTDLQWRFFFITYLGLKMGKKWQYREILLQHIIAVCRMQNRLVWKTKISFSTHWQSFACKIKVWFGIKLVYKCHKVILSKRKVLGRIVTDSTPVLESITFNFWDHPFYIIQKLHRSSHGMGSLIEIKEK